MKRTVQLFIEGERVELFNDEQISINLSVQNITDLSKTFTDFTQSFQVPAPFRSQGPANVYVPHRRAVHAAIRGNPGGPALGGHRDGGSNG